MVEVHVIPVPRGYTPLEAFEEIQTFGQLHGYRWWKPKFWFPHWAVIRVHDGS